MDVSMIWMSEPRLGDDYRVRAYGGVAELHFMD
jgi:hypothetical protein